MRDKYSDEVARTLWPHGFYKKFTDAGYRFGTTQMKKQEDPGLADGVFIALGGQASFIECKTGGDRFEFDRWTEKQRFFCTACMYSDISYWLFLVMGDRIGGKKNPRTAYLLEGEKMYDMILEAGSRKSLAYATAAERFKNDRLEWAGDSTWTIPLTHDFWSMIDGHTFIRHRTLRSSCRPGGDAAWEVDLSQTLPLVADPFLEFFTRNGRTDIGTSDHSNSAFLQPYQSDDSLSSERV